jgi:transmembrane sensor
MNIEMKGIKEICDISILLIKKKLSILTDDEKTILREYKEKHPATINFKFEEIVNGISEYETIDKEQAWDSLLLKSNGVKRKPLISKLITSYYKYAAIITLLFGIGYLYQNGYLTNEPQFVIPLNSITLQLENGIIEIISEDGKTEVIDSEGEIVGVQKEGALVYSSATDNAKKDSLVYNTLSVPYGKRFELLLSDGTSVHLNAGTSLRYPVKFIEGKDRRVFLEKGEVYFSVTKDVNHPFIVSKNSMDVRVLGTEFNISAYPEDEYINTVLVEGAVSIYNSTVIYDYEKSTNLEPGLLGVWNKKNHRVRVENVDVEMYTAWRTGKLILMEVSFEDMLKKIERQYDVSFVNNKESLNGRLFTARFDIEDIDLVMRNLSEYALFDYTIDYENNKITIN